MATELSELGKNILKKIGFIPCNLAWAKKHPCPHKGKFKKDPDNACAFCCAAQVAERSHEENISVGVASGIFFIENTYLFDKNFIMPDSRHGVVLQLATSRRKTPAELAEMNAKQSNIAVTIRQIAESMVAK